VVDDDAIRRNTSTAIAATTSARNAVRIPVDKAHLLGDIGG
jgi:hypothetical protein